MQQAITVATSQAQAEATEAAQRAGIEPRRQRGDRAYIGHNPLIGISNEGARSLGFD
jgi:hypothetical protein